MASSSFIFTSSSVILASSNSKSPTTRTRLPFISSEISFRNLKPQLQTSFSQLLLALLPKNSLTRRPHSDRQTERVQELRVYEINEGDRGSPAYLRLSFKSVNALGDVVPFTNKLYTGCLTKRIGITAGKIILIQHKNEMNGDRYEAFNTLYFGDYGSISIQGPYLSYDDTYLAVTGGTGIFDGVRGQVKLHNVLYPYKLMYTFYLRGINDLPQELVAKHVEPNPLVGPIPEAKALQPLATIAGFTD